MYAGDTATKHYNHTCAADCPTCAATNSFVVLREEIKAARNAVEELYDEIFEIINSCIWSLIEWWPKKEPVNADADFFSMDEKETHKCRNPPGGLLLSFVFWQSSLGLWQR